MVHPDTSGSPSGQPAGPWACQVTACEGLPGVVGLEPEGAA